MLIPSLTLLLLLLGSRVPGMKEVEASNSANSKGDGTNSGTCSSSVAMKNVSSVSGDPIKLQPIIPMTEVYTMSWQVLLTGQSQWLWVVTCRDSESKCTTRVSYKDRLQFSAPDWELVLQPALPEDSGRYCLEVSTQNGNTTRSVIQVSVGVRVQKPQLWWKLIAWNTTWCHLVANCSILGGNNVILTWYRNDTQLKQDTRPYTYLQEEVAAHSTHVYTCNASNAHSWDSSTLSLAPGCVDVSESQPGLALWLGYLGVPVIVVLLSVVTCVFLQRRRRRKDWSDAKEESAEQTLPQLECAQEHSPPGEGSTVYSMVQSRSWNRKQEQCSAQPGSESTTLYSLVQPSQKPQKGAPRAPLSSTIYQEVGIGHPQAQNSARLSRKELQNFEVYC